MSKILLIELYHLRCAILKALGQMSLEQIMEVKEDFKKMHERDYDRYADLFVIAIDRKREELGLKELIALIEQVENTPSDVTSI